MLRLMLLGIVGFALGLSGGWLNSAETLVSRSSAAEIDTARASALRTEPPSSSAVTPHESADAPDVVSESSGSGHAARKRRQLNAKLAITSGKPADLRPATKSGDTATGSGDDDDDDE